MTVSLTFADHINDDGEIQEVIGNVKKAIVEYSEHEGVAPEASETYTEKVEVSK